MKHRPSVDHYDDPLGLDDPLPEGKPIYAPQVPVIITGLSEEEDAARHIALRFDPNIQFCRNCETFTPLLRPDGDQQIWCDYCGDNLRPVGTAPRTRKIGIR